MMKKIGIMLYTLLAVLVLVSCSSSKKKKEETDKGIKVNIVDEIKFDKSYDDQMEDVPFDNPNMYQSTYMDVNPDFAVTVESTSRLFSSSELASSVSARDSKGQNVSLNVHSLNDTEKTLYEIKAAGGYKPGDAYTIELPNVDTLLFEGKSPEIRKILFTVKEEEKDNAKLKIDYTNYDFNKVTHFEGFGDYNTYLYYSGDDLDCSAGDIIMFSDGDTEKVYIKVKSVSTENGQYKIYYESADVSDIFEELDVHIDNREVDIENDFVLNDIQEIAEQIKNSEATWTYCYAVADAYGFLPHLSDFIDQVSFNFSFKATGNSFTLGAEATFTYTDSKGWRTVGILRFEWQKTLNVSGDGEIETFLGIPIGVSMNCSVGTDTRYSVQFCVTRKNKKFKSYNTEDTPKNLDMDKAREAVEDLQNGFTRLEEFGYKKDVVVGDTIMINVGHISFKYGWFSADFDLYACLKFQTDITIGAKYTYSTHEVLISYSTSRSEPEGPKEDYSDSAVSPSAVSAKTLNFYLCGTLGIEAYLKLRITIYITGLKYIANLAIDVDAGVYFDLSGMATGGYNFNTGQWDGNFGVSIEPGIFFRISLSVNLVWVVHFNWELYGVRYPMFKLGYKFDIRERSTNETLELNLKETEINNTNMLVFDAVDGGSLSVSAKQFKYDEQITWFETGNGNNKETYKLFTEIKSNSPDLTIQNGKLIIKEGVAETSGTITVKVRTNPFRERETTINFHYKSKDARNVTFDGQNSTSYLPGQKISFPTPQKRDGYIFRGWSLNGELVDYKNGYTMPENNINFTAEYIEDKYYTVNFYDGKNNLVYTAHVKTLEDAKAPDAETRDRFMDEEYVFVCYDKEFNDVTSDLEVHAIYERSGE